MTEPTTTTPSNPGPGSRLRVVVTLIVVIALGAALAWWLRPREEAARRPPVQARPTAPPAAGEPSPSPVTPPPERPTRREPRPQTAPTPEPESPPPAARAHLKVTSDVDGAFVFVDKQFIGKTPLDTEAVSPGRHTLNVSAEGYEGVAKDVEIASSGPTSVDVSLKTVRLNASVAVIHKHGVGSCEGLLKANPQGLRYETRNRDDGFVLPFSEVEVFTLDYREKTLRVKKLHGRTWNFTTHAPNADPLLVFQRDVDRARARLSH